MVERDVQTTLLEGRLNGFVSEVDNCRKLSEVGVKRALSEGIESYRTWMEANFSEMYVPLPLGRHKLSVYRDGRVQLRFMHGQILRQMLKETI